MSSHVESIKKIKEEIKYELDSKINVKKENMLLKKIKSINF